MLSIEFVKLVILFFHFKIFIGFSLYPLFLLWNFLIFLCLTHAFMMTTLKSLSDNLIQHHCHLGASIYWLPFFFIQLKIFLALCMMRNFWWKSGHFMYCLMRLWILNCFIWLLLTLLYQGKGLVTYYNHIGVEVQVVPSGTGSPHSPHGLHWHCRWRLDTAWWEWNYLLVGVRMRPLFFLCYLTMVKQLLSKSFLSC